MADNGDELGQLSQLESREVGFNDTLAIGGRLACRPPPGFLNSLTFADVLGCDHRGVMISAGEDEFVAQVEHEHVRVAPVERTVKRGVSLGRENDGGARLANDPGRSMFDRYHTKRCTEALERYGLSRARS
jgi:hypothetical protein